MLFQLDYLRNNVHACLVFYAVLQACNSAGEEDIDCITAGERRWKREAVALSAYCDAPSVALMLRKSLLYQTARGEMYTAAKRKLASRNERSRALPTV